MIIQSKAILASSGAGKTASHIFEGPKNERIETIQGNSYDMDSMVRDAQETGKKYGFVHFKINPKEKILPEQARQDFQAISKEYGFNLNDCTIVKHIKPRADGTSSNEHYHLIAPYVDSHGKALNMRSSFARNEKLGRLSEIRTGQALTQGQHNRAVYHQLMDEGQIEQAEQVKSLISRDRTHHAHTVNQQRTAEKRGIDLPAEKQAIRQLWKASDGMKAFKSALQSQGYEMKAGDKANTYIIEKNGVLVGAGNRLTGTKKDDFAKQYKEYENDTATAKTNNPASNIQPSQKISPEHRPDNGTTDTGNRRKPSGGNASTDNRQPSHDNRRATRIKEKQAITILSAGSSRIQKSNFQKSFSALSFNAQERIRKKKEQEQALKLMIEMVSELLNRLFGIPSSYQKSQIAKMAETLSDKSLSQAQKDKQNQKQLSNLFKSDFITENMLNRMSDKDKEKALESLKKQYERQSLFVQKFNKKNSGSLKNGSFANFLAGQSHFNEIAKNAYQAEKLKEDKAKALEILAKNNLELAQQHKSHSQYIDPKTRDKRAIHNILFTEQAQKYKQIEKQAEQKKAELTAKKSQLSLFSKIFRTEKFLAILEEEKILDKIEEKRLEQRYKTDDAKGIRGKNKAEDIAKGRNNQENQDKEKREKIEEKQKANKEIEQAIQFGNRSVIESVNTGQLPEVQQKVQEEQNKIKQEEERAEKEAKERALARKQAEPQKTVEELEEEEKRKQSGPKR